MKKVFCLFFTLCFLQVSVAQNKADKIMRQLATTVSGYDNMIIDFTYRLNRKNHKGKLYLSGDKYNLDFMGAKQIYDGKQTYLINSEDEEVTISNHSKTAAFNLVSFINSYNKDFVCSFVKNENRTTVVVALTPKKKSKLKKVHLTINTSNNSVKEKKDFYTDGGYTILTVNSFLANRELPQTTFRFNKKKFSDYYINYID